MSLGGSINNFCRKYKKPLTMLVIVFFVYKLFSYYGTVYEGNKMMGRRSTKSMSKARKQANDMAMMAEKARQEAGRNPKSKIAKEAAKKLTSAAAQAKIIADAEDV